VDVLDFPDAAGWEAWLAEHHEDQTQAWLRIAKRHSGMLLVTIAEALDVALCFGWIDGQRKALDDVSFLQRYSRRRPRSSWSKVNVAKVEALTAAGRMQPAGLAEVAAAKADGRWELAYESQRTAEVPPDLAAALAADPRANSAFASLGRSERYAVILPLLKARTAATRATVLDRVVARLAAPQQRSTLE
jgi:uncharacterized protein YdeI (YjbR/CyaY-like superfamily)